MTTASRVAIAALGFALVATMAYAVQRALEVALGLPVGPLAFVRQNHIAFFWRCAIATWWGGLGAVALYLVATRFSVEGLARVLVIATPCVCSAHALVAWFCA